MVVRTYAPCGQTPILREFLSYKHLSLIGAVTPQGRLFLKIHSHSITSREIVRFLGQLQRQIPGLLEQLPGYAPDLNPTEWVWSYLKIAELANIACHHLPELEALIQNSKRRMQQKPELIRAFVCDAGYEV